MLFHYKRYDSDKLSASDFERLIPEQLYKYRTINEYLFKTLETNSLWFSNPNDFNDPFDCRLDINLGKTKAEIIENLKDYTGLLKMKTKNLQKTFELILSQPAFYNDFMSKLHQVYINEKLGVCCLAEEPDNMLMWAHYAASHTGVCLEFEIERNGFFYRNLLPVQYKTRYPKFNLSDYNNRRRNLYVMHQQAVCTKSKLWEYESEWRVIVDSGAGPYEFEKKHLRRIIFGVRAKDESVKRVKQALLDFGYDNTSIYRSEPLAKSFGMKIKEIIL